MAATVTIQWRDRSKNETGFEVERCQGATCTAFQRIALLAADITTYTDTGLLHNTQYRYRVRAINNKGKSSYSNTITVLTSLDPDVPIPVPEPSIPAAPGGVACVAGDGKNSLSWNAVTDAVYTVKRALVSGGPYTPLVIGQDTRTYIDSAVTNGQTYYYVISASVLGISSLNSSQVSGTPTAASIPIPSEDVVSTVELGSGWATFPVVLPFGYATTGLQIAGFPTQTDIKNVYSDNSIKLAIVSAKIPSANSYEIREAALAAGTISPTIPTCTVTITYEGSNYTATMPGTLSDLWLNGPNVKEGSSTQTFVGAHAGAFHLRAIFDTRIYKDNSYRISITVKNNRNASGAKTCPINVSISINGAVVYTASNLNLSYLAQFNQVFTGNGLVESSIVPDFETMQVARVLPRYQAFGSRNPEYNSSGPNFEPLKIGDLVYPFSAPGIRPDIGLLPEWAAHYIHFKKASAREYTLKMGRNCSGAVSMHVDEEDDSLLHLDADNSGLFLSWMNGFIDNGILGGESTEGIGINYYSEVGAAHTPQLAWLPYLLTGDRYYLREMKYWGNHCMISVLFNRNTMAGANVPGAGIICWNQLRDIAWGMRDLSICAAWLPDADIDKSYFVTKLANNVTHLNWLEDQEPCTTLGGSIVNNVIHYPNVTSPESMWIHCYCVWAWDQMVRFGQTPPAHHLRMVTYWNSLFNADPIFDKRYTWSYHHFMISNTGTVFTTYAQLFDYNYNSSTEAWKNLNLATGTIPPIELGYGCEIRIILGIALKNSLSNALLNMNFVESVENEMLSNVINQRFQFAVDFET